MFISHSTFRADMPSTVHFSHPLMLIYARARVKRTPNSSHPNQPDHNSETPSAFNTPSFCGRRENSRPEESARRFQAL
ncbi:hypothetical protein BDV96DRAFT_570584 [Lophiotrema nucula]|uniref:Uncharacterized protein n=1 Tax=Lophiotrema nucula TaxID=690887 RepID=A0A6A5ZGY5_9PLEO|nr:hypothetical protein BDV96DRAFT_570584 [Lophiotrema nucula]